MKKNQNNGKNNEKSKSKVIEFKKDVEIKENKKENDDRLKIKENLYNIADSSNKEELNMYYTMLYEQK